MAITKVTNLSGGKPQICELHNWRFNDLIKSDKTNLRLYKENPDVLSEDEQLKMQVLTSLHKVNFPKDNVGTSFYASVIVQGIKCLKLGAAPNMVAAQMNNSQSSIYNKAADNVSCKRGDFHKHIEGVFASLSLKALSERKGSEVCGTSLTGTVSYGDLAFAIANETLRTINKGNKNTGGHQFVRRS